MVLDFYDSSAATRAISIFNTYLGQMSAKDLLILTIIAYKNECTTQYIEKIVKSSTDAPIHNLKEAGFIKGYTKEGRTKYWECIAPANDSSVYTDNCMYCFTNVIFNTGKYVRDYSKFSWNRIVSLAEIILRMEHDKVMLKNVALRSVDGSSYNQTVVRNKLVQLGVLKKSISNNGEYRVNRRAVLLGAN